MVCEHKRARITEELARRFSWPTYGAGSVQEMRVPGEVARRIAECAQDARTLCAFSETCKALHSFIMSPLFWSQFVQRRVGQYAYDPQKHKVSDSIVSGCMIIL
eukprot:TRINITY_DN9108_c0_g1_i1.p1 TRINITY_DN9108_c0_g1~~TRINITY_DN9108_c0_g1_i1.p1  ORF type:complete len:117 (+),score=4.78 TRINITY_DN9108_c0_g1_i1:41-352(+)